MNVIVVIPAYNEAKNIKSVIKQVKQHIQTVLVIDDASTDNTSKVAKAAGATVITQQTNQGAGAATRTGLKKALELGATHIITLDADGQHNPNDIPKLLRFAKKYDVVIGSRMINPKGMPLSRKFFNKAGSLITWLLYGIYVKDSQTGFKLFSHHAARKMKITFNRYEFCSEILYRIRKNKLTFKEVPIQVIYTKESLAKGQNFFNGVKMVWRMVHHR
ncbi:MAG: glycosyltransferase family 2 protein [Candidatus Woesearchaeota archaeon]